MEVGSILRRHAALARLDGEALERLVQSSSLVRLRRGEVVWHAGQLASTVVVVGAGLVKVMFPGGGTRDLVLGLIGPGEGLGECAVLAGDAHEADATAFTESVVIVRVPREAFVSAVEGSAAAAMALARMFGAAAQRAHRRLSMFTLSSEERLAATLIELGERFGDEMDDGSTFIPLRMTRAELAALVGTTVETTIRTLTRWSREGLVSTGEGRLTLHDVSALALRSTATPGPRGRALEAVPAE